MKLAIWPLRKGVFDALDAGMAGYTVKKDNEQPAYPYVAVSQVASSDDNVDSFAGDYLVSFEIWGRVSSGGTKDVSEMMDQLAEVMASDLTLDAPFECATFKGVPSAAIATVFDQHTNEEFIVGTVTISYFIMGA